MEIGIAVKEEKHIMYKSRLDALRSFLEKESCDGIVLTKLSNIRYFSGFRGDDTALFITADACYLVTDSRYTEQAGSEAPDYEIVEQREGLLRRLGELISSSNAKEVAFEGDAMTFLAHEQLLQFLEGVSFQKSLSVDFLREIKNATEIELIQKACDIADAAFAKVLEFIRPSVRETEVAAQLEYAMRLEGADGTSFNTIVASGLRGSMPHGTATEKKIEPGDFVTMDFGAKYQGYCSDITRTICVGQATERQREVYAAVLATQKRVLEEIAPGKSGKEIDRVAREELKKAHLEEYFTHGLGHSLGLEIHEEPRLSRYSKCEALRPGMLITDEPGVYISGWGGLRIEDTVLVTPDGCRPLTQSKKELIEIL